MPVYYILTGPSVVAYTTTASATSPVEENGALPGLSSPLMNTLSLFLSFNSCSTLAMPYGAAKASFDIMCSGFVSLLVVLLMNLNWSHRLMACYRILRSERRVVRMIFLIKMTSGRRHYIL